MQGGLTCVSHEKLLWTDMGRNSPHIFCPLCFHKVIFVVFIIVLK